MKMRINGFRKKLLRVWETWESVKELRENWSGLSMEVSHKNSI
jgi:hypothetical protein